LDATASRIGSMEVMETRCVLVDILLFPSWQLPPNATAQQPVSRAGRPLSKYRDGRPVCCCDLFGLASRQLPEDFLHVSVDQQFDAIG
jgi:hypothetical protein